jgi:tetratricopeptide (TPR) repeat protein
MSRNLELDALQHLADALTEDIVNTPGGMLLAEVLEDFGSTHALADEFDKTFDHALAAEFDSIVRPVMSSYSNRSIEQSYSIAATNERSAASVIEWLRSLWHKSLTLLVDFVFPNRVAMGAISLACLLLIVVFAVRPMSPWRDDVNAIRPSFSEEQARREKAEAELAKAWDAVQGTDDQAQLRDFIRRYPATQYTDAAKQRLEAAIRPAQEREEAARAPAAEERRQKAEAEMKRAFDAAEATSNQAVLRDFIRRYPDSPYVPQAKRHLDTLIAAEQERKKQATVTAKAESPAAVAPQARVEPTGAPPSDELKSRPTGAPPSDELKSLNDRVRGNPRDAVAFYRRGQLYARYGEFSRAIADFDEAIRLKPDDPEALNNRCWARAVLGDLQTAMRDCNEALAIKPSYADAFDSRGFVNLKSGQSSSAIADYDAALRINPKQASSLYGRGMAKLKTGNSTDAMRDITAAKALQPNIAEEFATFGIRTGSWEVGGSPF